MKLHLAPVTLAALVFAIAGCGDDSGSDGGDPAALAPPRSLIFIEGTVRPSGETKTNVDAIASRVAGVDNLGALIVEELESMSREENEPIDFEKDVEPWLGDRAGYFFQTIEDGDPSDGGAVIEVTDGETAAAFVEKVADQSEDPVAEGSYEGVEYRIDESPDPSVYGVVGDHLVIGEDEATFKAVVDASEGEGLDDVDRYDEAISAASEASLADVYVDIGGLIRQSEGEIDVGAQQAFDSVGIDPSDATAVASVIPGKDQVEIEISSDLAGEEPPEGDASELIGSMPADSLAAIGFSGFGEQVREALDTLDEQGIPGEIPPNQLKKGLKQSGIDLDGIVGSLGDAAVFASGSSERTVGGALVLTTEDPQQASNTVSNIGLLLRSAGTAGVTAIGGNTEGFSIRSDDLGDRPIAIATKGDRLAIGYGVAPTLRGLATGGRTLDQTPDYEDAVAALGETSISGFVDGRAALRLVDSLMRTSADREDRAEFRRARRYLRSISSVAIGSERSGDLAVARLIVSLDG